MDSNRDENINRSQSAPMLQPVPLNGASQVMLMPNAMVPLNSNTTQASQLTHQVSISQSDTTQGYSTSQEATEYLTESEEESEASIHFIRARTDELAPASRADSMPFHPNITYRSGNGAAEIIDYSTTQEYSPLETLGDGSSLQDF